MIETVKQAAPIISYASANVAPPQIEIRQEGRDAEVVIPPPRLLRCILHAVLWGLVVTAGLACAFVLVLAMAGATDPLFATLPVAIILGLVLGSILSIVRVVQVGAFGSGPALIGTCDGRLEIRSPAAFAIRVCKWHVTDVRGIELRETGLARVLLVHVRIVVILDEDRFESLTVPWNGKGSLMLAENRLRGALNLAPAFALNG